MKTITARISALALVVITVIGASLSSSEVDETVGDCAVAQAWSDVSASVGNALFAFAYRSRADALGLDDGDHVVAVAEKGVLAAVGNVLFAYDFRSRAVSRTPSPSDDVLALR